MSFSLQSILDGTIKQIEAEGLLPFGSIKLGKRTKPGITLFESLRNSLSMKIDDSVYMYWEWIELERFVSELWTALDESATAFVGRKTSAIAVAFEESLTTEEILKILRNVEFQDSTKGIEAISRRPTKSESSVRYVGKLLGACFTTIGIVEKANNCGYGDLFSTLSSDSRTNIELLSDLDEMAKGFDVPLTTLQPTDSVLILRALGWALEKVNEERKQEDQTPLTLSGFLFETEQSANWSGLSDQAILRRLLAISPETAETQQKAIAKFLAE